MLLSILILTLVRVTPHFRGFTDCVWPKTSTSMPRCPKRRNGGQLSAPATASLAAARSCLGDIEEVPSGLVEGYQQHQSADYHEFTTAEVATVRRELLSWYGQSRRMLPWRGDPPPWTRTADTLRLKNRAAGNGKRSHSKRGNKGGIKNEKMDDGAQPCLTAFFGGQAGECDAAQKNTTSNRKRQRGNEESASALATETVKSEGGDQRMIPKSAYGTWVSEVMLQQTRVETVVEYFVKWMNLFPTTKALAKADIEQVNEAWAGLGYYRRAKMLHEGAKMVQSEHGGSLPGTAKELKGLPGIGPYTAGAIASIAFGECEPLVDGNVIRVLSRLKAIACDPKNSGLNKLCWDMAGSIVDPDKPGDFNQALMELGATVCTVKSPSCSACPLSSVCLARKLVKESTPAESSSKVCKTGGVKRVKQQASGVGRGCGCDVCETGEDGMAMLPLAVTDYPRKAAKTLVKEQVLSVTVVERNTGNGPQVLLVKRPETGLLAGQWECACVLLRDGSEKKSGKASGKESGPPPEVPEKERQRAANALLFTDLGLSRDRVESRQSLGSVVHVFSHLRHTMQVERILLLPAANNPKCRDGEDVDALSDRKMRWVNVSGMGGVGITTGMKKVLELATKARSTQRRSSA